LTCETTGDGWRESERLQAERDARALQDKQQQSLFDQAPGVAAHCGREMAAWLDPNGTLQKTGLLIVDE
jgi:hypothetical protein